MYILFGILFCLAIWLGIICLATLPTANAKPPLCLRGCLTYHAWPRATPSPFG